jgi:hypothetical protein
LVQKYIISPQTIPNIHKNNKRPYNEPSVHKIYQHLQLKDPPKCTQIWIWQPCYLLCRKLLQVSEYGPKLAQIFGGSTLQSQAAFGQVSVAPVVHFPEFEESWMTHQMNQFQVWVPISGDFSPFWAVVNFWAAF